MSEDSVPLCTSVDIFEPPALRPIHPEQDHFYRTGLDKFVLNEGNRVDNELVEHLIR